MGTRLTPEMIISCAAMIELPLSEDEVGPVQDRLQSLMDSTEQFSHLIDNTAELDVRFNANWEQETA